MNIEKKLKFNCDTNINNIAFLEYMKRQEENQVKKNKSFGARADVVNPKLKTR